VYKGASTPYLQQHLKHRFKTIRSDSNIIKRLIYFKLLVYGNMYFFRLLWNSFQWARAPSSRLNDHTDTPHSVGLLWTSDQPNAETSTWRHTTLKRRTSVPQAGFEPAIPAREQPQTQALDHATTGAGMRWNLSVLQNKGRLLNYLGDNCFACLDFSLWDNLAGTLASLAVCLVFRDGKYVEITR
jgi:hypothetical protein